MTILVTKALLLAEGVSTTLTSLYLKMLWRVMPPIRIPPTEVKFQGRPPKYGFELAYALKMTQEKAGSSSGRVRKEDWKALHLVLLQLEAKFEEKKNALL